MVKIKNLIFLIVIILIDLAVYIILGISLMHYDDFYDESKGEYWSFASMTLSEKICAIGINVWNVINLIVIGFIIYRFVKRIIKTRHNSAYK
jgi:hypothetical protein